MAYLEKEDLYSHIYEENLDQITRDDDDKADAAIEAAVAEAKGFLNKYDLTKLFDGSVTDANLKMKVKDLAAWHLIVAANPNIDYAKFEGRYMLAIDKYFKLIQCGKISPEGWIFRDTTDQEEANGSAVEWSSNKKRRNYL